MILKNTAFVFPGQGSQEVGMGRAVAEAFPTARQIFEQADHILDFPLSRLCFEGPEAVLNDTINTQAALFVTSIATLAALKAAGYTGIPKYVAGHSLGEYSAYVAAGVLSFEDGLRLVRERGRLMKKAGEVNPGGMAAILMLDDEKVDAICQQVNSRNNGTLQVGNYNSPGQIVISGHESAVEKGMELALVAKARKVVRVRISVAAHSELMRVVEDEFKAELNEVRLNLPEMPIIANISAKPLTTVKEIRAEMEAQLTSSVRWTDSVRWMLDHGITNFIEIGPRKVLSSLIRRVNRKVQTQAVGTPEDIDTLLSSQA